MVYVFAGPDGYTYIFHKSHVKQLDQRGKVVKTNSKVKISDVYENGPTRIDVVAFRIDRKKTYMFYGECLVH